MDPPQDPSLKRKREGQEETGDNKIFKVVSKTAKHEVSTEILRIYYDKLFPISSFFRWLSFDQPQIIKRREFNFTLEGDIFIRYLAYANKEDFKKDLLKKLPHKIDIGAIFNAMPSMHNSVKNLVPEQKELVFDIDMTDYDDIRTCCTGADICHKCWPLMTVSIEIIDTALREDFGFEHILWVYSGRRGVHCWVCDRRARVLDNAQRDAVVSYLSLQTGGDKKRTKEGMDLSYPLHPSLKRAYDICLKYFDSFIEDQKLFSTREGWTRLLGDCIDASDLARLSLSYNEDADPVDRWADIKKAVNRYNQKEKKAVSTRLCLQKMVFKHLYPRLDVEVTKHLNHLLKSPFSVHPKTGRVCVPINPARVGEFDPFKVPTINELMDQLNDAPSSQEAAPRRLYASTSLRPYVEMFKDFVGPLVEAEPKDSGEKSLEF
jgi:DNA primase small subunit